MRIIYVCAAKENTGKTLLSFGLIKCLLRKKYRVAYLKPVSQKKVFDFNYYDWILEELEICNERSIYNPICIELSKTINETSDCLMEKIEESLQQYETMGIEYVVMEGAGNMAVGGVLGISNAEISSRFNINPIILVPPGYGKMYDLLKMNQSYCNMLGCYMKGIIINNINNDKYTTYVREVRDKFGNEKFIGFLPRISLSEPTVQELLEDICENIKMLKGINHEVLVKKYNSNYFTNLEDRVNVIIIDSDIFLPEFNNDTIIFVCNCLNENIKIKDNSYYIETKKKTEYICNKILNTKKRYTLEDINKMADTISEYIEFDDVIS